MGSCALSSSTDRLVCSSCVTLCSSSYVELKLICATSHQHVFSSTTDRLLHASCRTVCSSSCGSSCKSWIICASICYSPHRFVCASHVAMDHSAYNYHGKCWL